MLSAQRPVVGMSPAMGTPRGWGSVPPHPAQPGATGTAGTAHPRKASHEVVSSLQYSLTGDSWVTPGTPMLGQGYQVAVTIQGLL